jgi:deoxyadenosine/deoxycytidine kinase
MRYDFIAIEGNIGAGKTTLAAKLASAYDARLLLEEFDSNPFLPKFYAEPSRYAFPLELSFLADRFHQVKEEFRKTARLRVADYYFNKSLVFASANLNGDELNVFKKFFAVMEEQLPRPGLVVFLNPLTHKLRESIRRRGRTYEQEIPDDYLSRIQQKYLEYLGEQQDVPVLQIDMESTRYVNSLDDMAFLDRLLNKAYEKGLTRVTL